jgi:integrase
VERTLVWYHGAFHLDPPETAASRRVVAIPTPVVELLRAHRLRQLEQRLGAPAWGNEWELVFTNEIGEPIGPRAIHHSFSRVLKDAGLRHVRFHDLRLGAATFLLAQGVPMKVVQEVLGHAQMSITADLYSHVVPELRREAADRIGEGLFGRA